MELFVPTCQFLMARAFSNDVSGWGVIFGFQEVLKIIKNDIQEVEVNVAEVQRVVYKESKKKDCKALFLIQQCVDSTNFEKISHGGACKIKKVKPQSLRRQYELLFINDQESIGNYFTRIQMLVNSMKACGEKLLD
ncbi:hypothetical protein CR513_19348, partial [Mucuna pruriens]